MNPIVRAYRKFLAARRARHWHNEVLHLLDVQAALGPALDRAMRRRDAARLERLFLDIHGRRDGGPTRASGYIGDR